MFSIFEYCKNHPEVIVTNNPSDIKIPFPNEVSVFYGKSILSDAEISNRNRCAFILEKGLDWLFEKAKTYQPNFYAVLQEKKCALYYFARPIPSPWNEGFFYYDSLCVLGDGVAFAVDSTLVENWIEEEALYTTSIWRNLFCAIPREIVGTYFWRASSFARIENESFQFNAIADFPTIHNAADVLTLASSATEKKQLRKSLDALRQGEWKGKGDSNFVIFLDTFESQKSAKERDVLLFERNVIFPKIYCIPNMDFAQIQLISNPAAVVDSYVSHLLLTQEKISFAKSL